MISTRHWIIAGGLAVSVHAGAFYAAFYAPTAGSQSAGSQGIEFDLGMVGDLGASVQTTVAQEEVKEVEEAIEDPVEDVQEVVEPDVVEEPIVEPEPEPEPEPIVEPEPVKPPQPQVINASSKVFFKHAKKVIGDPQTHLNWPCATIGNTGGAGHIIKPWSGALANNSLVRILTKDRTVAKDGYHHMYCSDIGNVYYDKQRANKKQQWKIMKTNAKTNSPGKDLCYGDTVKIANGKWSKANLGINGKWCQCVNDDSTVWVLVKKP